MSFGSTIGQVMQPISGALLDPNGPQGNLPDGANPEDASQVYMPTMAPPGMGGKGGMPAPGSPSGPSGAPGMGGKGPLSQIPIDMSGNVLGTNQPPMPEQPSMGGLPPAPIAAAPLAKVSGGTPGRPSASAPIVPRGVGFNNPGAPGAPPQQPMERGILTNPQGQPQPFQPRPQPRLQPAPVVRPAIPRQAPTIAQPVRLAGRGAGARW